MTEMEQMLLEQNKQLITQIALLTEQVQVLPQKLYGRSSEKARLPMKIKSIYSTLKNSMFSMRRKL